MVTTLEPLHTRHCTLFRARRGEAGTVLTTAAVAPPAGAEPATVGYFAARLVLFRLLALGADPSVLLPAGCATAAWDAGIVAGIRQALAELELTGILAPPVAGHGPDGNARHVSLTAMGTVAADKLLLGGARPGDALFVAGHPMDTPWAMEPGRGKATLPRLAQLKALRTAVSDCAPAEAGGVAEAAGWLARAAGLSFQPVDALPDWLWSKPAGAATCLVVAVPRDKAAPVMALPIPVTHIGTLVLPTESSPR